MVTVRNALPGDLDAILSGVGESLSGLSELEPWMRAMDLDRARGFYESVILARDAVTLVATMDDSPAVGSICMKIDPWWIGNPSVKIARMFWWYVLKSSRTTARIGIRLHEEMERRLESFDVKAVAMHAMVAPGQAAALDRYFTRRGYTLVRHEYTKGDL